MSRGGRKWSGAFHLRHPVPEQLLSAPNSGSVPLLVKQALSAFSLLCCLSSPPLPSLSLHSSCSPPLASILFLFSSFLLFLLPCCLCLLSSIHLTHKGSWASGRELKSSEKRLLSTAGHMKPVPESSRLDKGSTPQSGKK